MGERYARRRAEAMNLGCLSETDQAIFFLTKQCLCRDIGEFGKNLSLEDPTAEQFAKLAHGVVIAATRCAHLRMPPTFMKKALQSWLRFIKLSIKQFVVRYLSRGYVLYKDKGYV